MKKVVIALIIFVSSASAALLIKQSGQRVKGVNTEKQIYGIILPHHDFAKEVLTQSYETLDSDYELVVIIGPNHFYPETKEVITSDFENGINASDILVKNLINNIKGIELNNQLVEGEHSIGLQKKYLSQYFPKAAILPIVVPPNLDEAIVEDLINFLFGLSAKTLFIASVDFAHEVGYLEALENNKESIDAIRAFDYDTISTYDDQHMDSQKSIEVLLRLMQKINATDFRVLHSTHGALLVDDPMLQGTSYVIGVFEK